MTSAAAQIDREHFARTCLFDQLMELNFIESCSVMFRTFVGAVVDVLVVASFSLPLYYTLYPLDLMVK